MQQIEQQNAVATVAIEAPALMTAAEPLETVEQLPGNATGADDAAEWLGTQNLSLTAIERLKAVIDEETSKLQNREAVDFDSFSQRKNRGLLELTRAMRTVQDVRSDPRVSPQLTQLRASLIRNQAALQIHLDAVREVSAIIARSIQDVESDGTYSLSTGGKGK